MRSTCGSASPRQHAAAAREGVASAVWILGALPPGVDSFLVSPQGLERVPLVVRSAPLVTLMGARDAQLHGGDLCALKCERVAAAALSHSRQQSDLAPRLAAGCKGMPLPKLAAT